VKSGNRADRHDGVHAPEGLPWKGLQRVAMVIENAALGNDRSRAEGIDAKNG
jgi:hypothetical protein